MARICPQCKKEYADDVLTCPADNSPTMVVKKKDSWNRDGEILAGRFTITGLLGKGGMGAVYRARQHSIDRDVAIKVMRADMADDKEAVARFFREAKAASLLTGPHSITVFDFGQTENEELYLVMELLNGRPLSKAIREDGPMPEERAVSIAVQTLEALAEAHSKGILHRDLKPDNIFLVEGDETHDFVKVLDFGIAKLASDVNSHLTATGMVFGTPVYMSPEQSEGKELDSRSDIYSLGSLLYEMLAGSPPYKAETPLALLVKKLKEEPQEILVVNPQVKVSEELEKAVRRLLSIDPTGRPMSARDAKQELLLVSKSSGSSVSLPSAVLKRGTMQIPNPVHSGAAQSNGVMVDHNQETVLGEGLNLGESGASRTDGGTGFKNVGWNSGRSKLPLVILAIVVLAGTVAGLFIALGMGDGGANTAATNDVVGLVEASDAMQVAEPANTEPTDLRSAGVAPDAGVKDDGIAGKIGDTASATASADSLDDVGEPGVDGGARVTDSPSDVKKAPAKPLRQSSASRKVQPVAKPAKTEKADKPAESGDKEMLELLHRAR